MFNTFLNRIRLNGKVFFGILIIAALQASYTQAITQKVKNETKFIQKAQIKSKNLQSLCNNAKSTFLITYPQVEKLNNKARENKINQYLKKEFTKFKNGKCEDDNQGETYQEEITYQVKMNNKGLLSIYYMNIGYLKKAAHPNNVSDSFNISLNTGNPIVFKNLFKKDKNYLNKINYQIKKSLEKQNIDIEYQDSKTDFDFYLTDKQLVIINLFDFHAAQSVEAYINYSDIKDIIDLNGTLKSLL